MAGIAGVLPPVHDQFPSTPKSTSPLDAWVFHSDVASPARGVIASARTVGVPLVEDSWLAGMQPTSTAVAVGTQPEWTLYEPGNGFVYVTNYGSNNVSVLNGSSVVGTIEVGANPQSAIVDLSDDYVYVSNTGSANVSVVRGTALVATIAVGSTPKLGAVDLSNGYVYVPNYGSGNVSVVNSTHVVASVPVGTNPIAAIYDNGDGYVYVVNQGSANVSVINGTSIVASIRVGSAPEFPAFDPQNGNVYVPNYASNNVTVIHGTHAVSWLPAGGYPNSALYDAANGLVYVVNLNTDNLSVINDTITVGNVTVGSGPGVGPQFATYSTDNGYLYVPTLKNVSVVQDLTLLGYRPAGSGTAQATFDPKNGCVYVANSAYTSNTVTVLSTRSTVTFRETGLPPGLEWWINLTGGVSTSSTSGTLSVQLADGWHFYTASSVDRTYAAARGSFTVSDSPRNVTVSFSRVTYPVTFNETGLAGATPWSVTLRNVTNTSQASMIQFSEPNGSGYIFSVSNVSGYTVQPSSGAINVSGAPAVVMVIFTPVRILQYPLWFNATGLSFGLNWSVLLIGTGAYSGSETHYNTTDSIEFLLPAGFTGEFTINSPTSFSASPASGTVQTPPGGSPQTVVISFAQGGTTAPPSIVSFSATPDPATLGGVITILVRATGGSPPYC